MRIFTPAKKDLMLVSHDDTDLYFWALWHIHLLFALSLPTDILNDISIRLLVKLELVDNFIHHFSLCSDGQSHQIQTLLFNIADGLTVGRIMSGRKHLLGIESRLDSSCERAIKHSAKR